MTNIIHRKTRNPHLSHFAGLDGTRFIPLSEYWYDRHVRSWVVRPATRVVEWEQRGIGTMHVYTYKEARDVADNMAEDILQRTRFAALPTE